MPREKKQDKKNTKAANAKNTKKKKAAKSAKVEKTTKKATKPEKKAVVKKEKKATIKKEEKKKRFAVIKTGGKQYKVHEGREILIEKIEAGDDKSIFFEEVLLVAEDKDVKVGTPKVSGAKVEAEVLSQEKGPKIVVFKMKPKKRYRKKTGHCQKLTKVKIKKISA